jgi:ATP-binding cassette subfamily B protein
MNSLPAFVHFESIINEANNFLSTTSKIPEKNIKIEAITANKISFSYGTIEVFKNLSFHFEKGKKYLLFGPSGKGKTTTLDILSGLIHPTSGEITFNNDQRLNNLDIIKSISYVLQDTLLFQGTLAENLSLNNEYTSNELETIVEKVGLKELMLRLPNGLNSFIAEGSASLSGGEKQRIAIARALLKQSDLLLLDEITSALDVRNEQKILELLDTIKHEAIIVIVGHRESLIDWTDEVIYY